MRSAEMASSKSFSNKGGMPLSSHTQDSILPYWVRYNTDFKRQKEIKDFNMVRKSIKKWIWVMFLTDIFYLTD